jgi:hypothetical protein
VNGKPVRKILSIENMLLGEDVGLVFIILEIGP